MSIQVSNQVVLNAEPRTLLGKKANRLRQAGLIPATVYGKNFEPQSIQIEEKTFTNTFRRVGHSVLVELAIPGQPNVPTFVHDVQRHPLYRNIIHADFRAVDPESETHADVPIVLVGVSPIVARGDAIINQGQYTIRVVARPVDMPPRVDVDMSRIARPGQVIRVRDLPIADKYKLQAADDVILVSLTAIKRRVVAAATD